MRPDPDDATALTEKIALCPIDKDIHPTVRKRFRAQLSECEGISYLSVPNNRPIKLSQILNTLTKNERLLVPLVVEACFNIQ
jgi:hypothetical protein